MAKKAHTTKRRTRGVTAAGRQRQRSRPRRAAPVDLEVKVEEARRLARPDAPLDLIRDYVKIGMALDEELTGRRDANLIKELSTARMSFAVRLGITPREHGLAGEFPESVAAALARATDSTKRVLHGQWKALQQDIRLLGHKDGAKELYVRAIARLRETRPKLFSPAELMMPPKALFERIFAKGRSSRPPSSKH